MKPEHVTAAIEALKNKQSIFHSEADFQFSLAWELQKILPRAKIRLEYCPPYKSKSIETTLNNEYFKLKNHGAQDIGRYDYLYDISRIERMGTLDKDFNGGYAIMLTNEPSYWKPATNKKTVDAAFRIHEGRVVEGSLAWAENVGPGTSKGRTQPINIAGQYVIHWDDYSHIPNTSNSHFKLCIITV